MADSDDPRFLPWPYVAVLLAEVSALGWLAATHDRPPWTYELGWAGTASMLVMQLYSVRRRVRALRRLGRLRAWLDAHIFLGFQGFVLVAYHGIGVSPSASLAALSFYGVAIVVMTGVVGRYLYGLLPRARAYELHVMAASVPGFVAPPTCLGLMDLVRRDLRRRDALRAVRRDAALTDDERAAALRAIELATRIAVLEIAERYFARWTVLHRPLALVLLATTTLHVLAHFVYAA